MRIIAIILLGLFTIPLLPLRLFLSDNLLDKLLWRFRNTWFLQLISLLVFIVIFETMIKEAPSKYKNTQDILNDLIVIKEVNRSPLNAIDFDKQEQPAIIRSIFEKPSDYK